jgi:hypothetical protein
MALSILFAGTTAFAKQDGQGKGQGAVNKGKEITEKAEKENGIKSR